MDKRVFIFVGGFRMSDTEVKKKVAFVLIVCLLGTVAVLMVPHVLMPYLISLGFFS